jgi:hypothetical protein
LAGIVTPPLILGGAGGANFDAAAQQYLVSASLIVCGILSSIQITRFHFYKTPYYLGTGLIRYGKLLLILMIVLWEHHLPQFQLLAEHLRNGMQMEHVQWMHPEHIFLVPKDTAQFLEQHAFVHFSKSD